MTDFIKFPTRTGGTITIALSGLCMYEERVEGPARFCILHTQTGLAYEIAMTEEQIDKIMNDVLARQNNHPSVMKINIASPEPQPEIHPEPDNPFRPESATDDQE